MTEYVIISKTAIQQRIEELEKLYKNSEKPSIQGTIYYKLIQELEQILSQSTPLIPEIEKAWKDGRDGTKVVGSFPYTSTKYVNNYYHKDEIETYQIEEYVEKHKLYKLK